MINKKERNLKRRRDFLDSDNGINRKVVLNSMYAISPPDFDPPAFQRRIIEAFPAPKDGNSLTLFRLNEMRLNRRSKALKVAICAMPKSGSTFFLTSLKRLKGIDFNIGYFHVPYDNPSFVDAVQCENEIDELALLRHEMMRLNTLIHTHTKCSPYTEKMMASFNYKPIITQRNIFDCVVSMDNMITKGHIAGFSMFRPPRNYSKIERPERLEYLCQYVAPWYIDFIVSWARTRLKPLMLDYEKDLLGFDRKTALKIRSHLDLTEVNIDVFCTAFELKTEAQKISARLNKGVSGRGEAIPQTARDAVKRLADIYQDEVDFTGLL